MIDLEITVDASDLERWELVPPKAIGDMLKIVAAEGMGLMRERVAKGESLTGGAFKTYDPDYQDRKSRAGRMGENYWLRLSGWMWKTQKVFVEKVGDVIRAVITFEGMRPQVSIGDPAKGSAFRRTARSQRGGFEGTWRKKEAQRRSKARAQGKATGRRLTVNIDKGDMVSSATVAEANDRLRPFIGFNPTEADRLAAVFSDLLDAVLEGVGKALDMVRKS